MALLSYEFADHWFRVIFVNKTLYDCHPMSTENLTVFKHQTLLRVVAVLTKLLEVHLANVAKTTATDEDLLLLVTLVEKCDLQTGGRIIMDDNDFCSV